MSYYNPRDYLFSDLYSGLLNYSAINYRTGYSEVEATCYAVLSLGIIGRISFLSEVEQDNIFDYIKGFINLSDGGFHPGNKEPSSILLSYYCYSTLKILDSQPLTQTEINALGYFTFSMQCDDPDEALYYGGFYDNDFLTKFNVETSFYAVSLMDELEKINDLPRDVTSNKYYIDALFYRLQVSIDTSMDIVAMLCKDFGITVHDDYANIQELEKKNLISTKISENLCKLNGLRNVIVHKYNKIEEDLIVQEKDLIVSDLNAFLELIDVIINEKLSFS